MEYFKIYEFVDPVTYHRFGENAVWFIDPRLIKVINKIRFLLGVPITINDWKWGGDREWSGLRTPNSPYYSMYSQHSFGRAIDGIVKGMSASEVREKVEKFYNEGLLGFEVNITMEYGDGITWLHLDIRCDPETPHGEVRKFYI